MHTRLLFVVALLALTAGLVDTVVVPWLQAIHPIAGAL